MKRTLTALLFASALLLSPMSASANKQAFIDVTNATQNAIVTKISDANIMGASYENKFWPEETVTRGELADIISRAYKLYNVRPAKQFNDVDASTDYADAIQQLYRAGIIDGTADGDFNPDDEVKRTHVAKILTNLLKLKPTTTTKFKDVPKNDANNGYIGALVSKGIIAGYPDGTFKPNQFVTRMNMATFIYRALYGKETQIANKKVKSNTAYAATKLKAANYFGLPGSSYYVEFNENGNAKPKINGMTQKFSENYIQISLDDSEIILMNTDLRNLVEFKPYKQNSIRGLPYLESYGVLLNGSYTITPYFNQSMIVNEIKFTDVLKIVHRIEVYSNSYLDNSHEAIFYFKEGYGLLAHTFDDEIILGINSYKLR
ncbi:MAG: S-layer homology domain-containing protein [Caryophanon sp.]|nr:S-layer homology domain-containing protein [Caryophanon sp.]